VIIMGSFAVMVVVYFVAVAKTDCLPRPEDSRLLWSPLKPTEVNNKTNFVKITLNK
jgi:hypothetical protein